MLKLSSHVGSGSPYTWRKLYARHCLGHQLNRHHFWELDCEDISHRIWQPLFLSKAIHIRLCYVKEIILIPTNTREWYSSWVQWGSMKSIDLCEYAYLHGHQKHQRMLSHYQDLAMPSAAQLYRMLNIVLRNDFRTGMINENATTLLKSWQYACSVTLN